MKLKDIQPGNLYIAKVSEQLEVVRIKEVEGVFKYLTNKWTWRIVAINIATGQELQIKSSQLKRAVPQEDAPEDNLNS